jgi:predicted dehydrogenase
MISEFHARAIADVPGAKVVACASRAYPSAEKFALRHGGRALESVAALVRDPQVAIVSICTPSGAHMEPAVMAANAGKHVLIEKPLEISRKRCDKIIEACERNQVKLGTVFPSRFHDCWRELKRAVDSKRFGQLTLAGAYVKWFRTQQYYDSGQWRGTWSLDGGGALMNQAIHTIDLLQWIMGPVESVNAMTATLAHERIEVEDTAVATLRFANGALGTIEATTASYPGMLKKIEIHGSEGSAIVEEEDIKHWKFAKSLAADKKILEQWGVKTSTGGGASDPAAIGHSGHTKLFKDFISAIKKDRSPLIDGHEGRKSVAIIEAIYAAAKSGKTQKIV